MMFLIFILILIIVIFYGFFQGNYEFNQKLLVNISIFKPNIEKIYDIIQNDDNYTFKYTKSQIANFINSSYKDKMKDFNFFIDIHRAYNTYIFEKIGSVYRPDFNNTKSIPTFQIPNGMQIIRNLYNGPKLVNLINNIKNLFSTGKNQKIANNIIHFIPEETEYKYTFGNKFTYDGKYSKLINYEIEILEELYKFICFEYNLSENDLSIAIVKHINNSGIKLHIDGFYNNRGPIIVLNLNKTIYYDMYPIFTNDYLAPIRVKINSGDLAILDGESRYEWAHSIPENIPNYIDRYAILIKIKKETENIGYAHQTNEGIYIFSYKVPDNNNYIKFFYPKHFVFENEKLFPIDDFLLKENLRLYQFSFKNSGFRYYRGVPRKFRFADAHWNTTIFTRLNDNWSADESAIGNKIIVDLSTDEIPENFYKYIKNEKIYVIITKINIDVNTAFFKKKEIEFSKDFYTGIDNNYKVYCYIRILLK